VAAAVTVVGGVSLVAAPGASAAAFIVNPDTCADLGGVVDGSDCLFENVTIEEGDIWLVDGINLWNQRSSTFNNNGVIEVADNWNLGNVQASVFNNNGTINLADGSILFNFNANSTFNNNGVITYCLAVIDAVVGGNEPVLVCPEQESQPEATAADAPPIPDWFQAYGRFGADATCLEGWTPSWAMWAVPATGGWVCERSIPSYG
jgi:hypothetical protein